MKDTTMTLIVHHPNNSRSQRLLWMLEELDLPYEVRFYERKKSTMPAPPELKSVHPLGKTPLLEDGAVKQLASRPWFAGKDMTAADVTMSCPLEAATSRAGLPARTEKRRRLRLRMTRKAVA